MILKSWQVAVGLHMYLFGFKFIATGMLCVLHYTIKLL